MDEYHLRKKMEDLAHFYERTEELPIANKKEEIKLFSQIKQDSTVKDKIVENHFRIVADYANAYFLSHGFKIDIDIDELIHAGITGLFRAIDKYDYKKDFIFTNYAKWWVRHSMSHYLSSLE